MDPLIKSDDVHNAFMDCLYTERELVAMPQTPPPEAVIVKGITKHIGFQPTRLEEKREAVKQWILGLHPNFLSTKDGGGGGWTFLNMCNDKNDVQWTDFHQVMEELTLMAMGLEMAEFQLPREVWSSLPGGVPYIAFYPNGKEDNGTFEQAEPRDTQVGSGDGART